MGFKLWPFQKYSSPRAEGSDEVELLRVSAQDFAMPVLPSDGKQVLSFDAIVVRVELTGLTQMFWEQKDELFAPLLAEYFSGAKNLIARYGGYFYLQVGSELIFYFRDNSPQVGAIAFSCVRSIFELAQDIESSRLRQSEVCFKLKSSLVHGKLRIFSQEQGKVLQGLPLIEGAKLLAQFDDKAKNLLCFYEKSHHCFSYLCEIENFKESVLKNFKEPMNISKVVQYKSLQSFVLRKNFQAFSYFRSDRDILFLLDYFFKNLSGANEEDLALALKCYKNMDLGVTSEEVKQAAAKLRDIAEQRQQDQWIQAKTLELVESFVRKMSSPAAEPLDIVPVVEVLHKRAA